MSMRLQLSSYQGRSLTFNVPRHSSAAKRAYDSAYDSFDLTDPREKSIMIHQNSGARPLRSARSVKALKLRRIMAVICFSPSLHLALTPPLVTR